MRGIKRFMNIKLYNQSFGSVNFTRTKVGTGEFYDYYNNKGIIENDGKPDVYFDYDKVFESKKAQEMTDKNKLDANYMNSKEYFLDLIEILKGMPKPGLIKRLFSQEPAAKFYRMKNNFIDSFKYELKKIDFPRKSTDINNT